MKKKILFIGMGVLIGVIITTIGFCIYINCKYSHHKFSQGNPPQMMQGQNMGEGHGFMPRGNFEQRSDNNKPDNIEQKQDDTKKAVPENKTQQNNV